MKDISGIRHGNCSLAVKAAGGECEMDVLIKQTGGAHHEEAI